MGGSGEDSEKTRRWQVCYDLLPKVSRTFALAIDEGPRHDPKTCNTTATKNDQGYVLNGTKQFVMDGACADQLIVSAKTEKGQTLFLLDAQAAGLSRADRVVAATGDRRGDSRSVARGEFRRGPEWYRPMARGREVQLGPR